MAYPLQQAILRTLCYFDIFEYPLTCEELRRFLWQPGTLVASPELNEAVADLEKIGRIEADSGYYFLPGSRHSVARREQAVRTVDVKLRIAKKAAKKLRFIPFVQAIFVTNSVAAGVARRDSDIDLFIVITQKRLWIARLFILAVLDIFHARPSHKKSTDALCPCFLITDDSLDLSRVALPQPDVYLTYWLHQLVPLYDPGHVYTHFMTVNGWAGQYIPQAMRPYQLSEQYRVEDSVISRSVKKFFERAWAGVYGDTIQSLAKQVQAGRVEKNYGGYRGGQSTNVVVDDTMVKTHVNDRREHYRRLWEERVERYASSPYV